MFGLREEVIAALLLVALLIIGVAGLYVRHVFNDRANLELRVAQQAGDIRKHEKAEADLHRDAVKKERSYAENARQKAAIAADLEDAHADLEELRARSAPFREWSDGDLPADYVDRLRADSDLPRAGRDQADATGGPARGHADAEVPRAGQTEEQGSGGLRRHR